MSSFSFPRFALACSALTIAVTQLLAQTPDLVGTLPTDVSVDNKGSANISIPLQIPAGRAGLQPQLALTYNSQSGNGALGVGWSISTGFPQSITRGRSVLARDGEVRGVTFDNTKDKFYLDGKRLICVSGTHGAPGSIYRTEVDSFITITTSGTGSSAADWNIETFIVTDKSGMKMTFGKVTGADDGYQVGYIHNAQYQLVPDTLAYAYALKRVEDTIGNYISFSYTNPAGGEYHLSRIDYTGASPQAYVDLAYETRADQPRTYLGRRSFERSQRLKMITARSKAGADYTTAAVYSLGYSNADSLGTTTGRSRMTSIAASLADADSGALRSVGGTAIHWTDTVRAYTPQGSQFVMPSNVGSIWGDFNGDGKVDYAYSTTDSSIYVCLSNGSSLVEPALWAANPGSGLALITGDIDGDGKTDLIRTDSGGAHGLRSNGTSFSNLGMIANFGTLLSGAQATEEGNGVGSRIVMADFTGDGRDDILVASYDRYLYLWESTGNSYTPKGVVSGLTGSVDDIGTVQVDLLPTFFGPLVGARGIQGFAPYRTYLPGPNVTIMPMDVNGDGRKDYVALYTKRRHRPYSSVYDLERRLQIMISRPDGTFSAPRYVWFPAPSTFNTEQSNSPVSRDSIALGVLPGDYNGDGLMDFLCLTCNANGADPYWKLILWDGMGYDGEFSYQEYSYVLPTTVNIQGETDRTYCNVITNSLFERFMSDAEKIGRYPAHARVLHVLEAGRLFNTFAFDVNGDGLTDLVWYVDKTAADVDATASKGWYAMLSTGKISNGVSSGSFTGPIKLADSLFGGPPGGGNMGGEFNSTEFALTGDLDGDGRPDLFRQACYNGQVRSYGNAGLGCNADLTKPAAFDDVVDQVTDGLGRTTEIVYKGAMDDSVYTPGATVTYPIRELRSSSPVVAYVYKDSGGSTPARFSYQYSGNRLDLSGRGPLGFHAFVTFDHQTRFLKYQFLTQSFPMTGLTAREQTYRFWDSGSDISPDVNFRLISSHDNTIVFDEVVNGADTSHAYGTVYPFISKAIESRWENSSVPHFSFSLGTSGMSKPDLLFPAARPTGAHIAINAQSWFDNQSLSASPPTTLPGLYSASDRSADWSLAGTNTVTGISDYATFDALTFPREITYGNLRQLSTEFGDGFTEKVVTTYKAPASNGLTGLVDTVSTSVSSSTHGTEVAPVKSYTYWSNGATPTPLVATETIDASDNALDLTTSYTRDGLGRITATAISGFNNPGHPQHIGSYTVSAASAFDGRFDLPTTSKNAYEHSTNLVYHPFFAQSTSVTDVNGAQIKTQYDALGRVIKVTDVLKGIETSTAYEWDFSQTVSPPAGVAGIATTSVYRAQTTATVQPAVTTYYDRLSRAIRTIQGGFAGQQVVTDTIYNVLGQVVATSIPYKLGATPLWTRTTYDALGRVSTVTAPNGTVTTSNYNGRVTQVTVDATDREPQTNTTYVDAKGRTIKVWNADNVPSTLDPVTGSSTTASIEFRLDGFGRMRETVLRDQSQTITATYDALGRQTALNDPDKGPWSYVNNTLGQVVTQTDAKSNVTQSVFDRLGRQLTRTTTEPNNGPVETANWYYYDTAANVALYPHLVAKGDQGWIGALQREEAQTTGAPGYAAAHTQKAYYYDAKGRVAITLNTVDGKWFYTHTDYDTYSRVQATRHYWRPAAHELPSDQPYVWQNFGYTYTYDGSGATSKSYLLTVGDTAGRTWWQADSSTGYDHLDRPVLVRKGSGHWTRRTYRASDGLLDGINTANNSVQFLTFDYDGLGNLVNREDQLHELSEVYSYDNLNRITHLDWAEVAAYHVNGNIKWKKDVAGNTSADYQYISPKPHAATSAFGYTMSYDANGNMLTRTGSDTTWSTRWAGFDKPRWLAKTTGGVVSGSEFTYDANRSRVLHLEFDATAGGVPSHYTRKKVYGLGPTLEVDYKNTAASGTPAWQMDKVRIYVPGPEGIVGTLEYSPFAPSDQDERPLVYHYDHLGSIETITPYGSTATTPALDEAGRPSRFAYDAWGERRNAASWSGAPANTSHGGHDSLTPRGYTGHEMLDGLDLIHMNGRIYDPLLGRMLSADVLVQFPDSQQSYNRYSYVRNNPLSTTDPSGFAEPITTTLTTVLVLEKAAEGTAAVVLAPEAAIGAAIPLAGVGVVTDAFQTGGLRTMGGGGNGPGVFTINYMVSSNMLARQRQQQQAQAADMKTKTESQKQSSAPVPAVEGEKTKENTSGGQMDPNSGGGGDDKKKSPNPDGSKGKADHQAATDKLFKEMQEKYPESQGYTVEVNKSIKNETGVNRRPDVTVKKDGKVVEVHEVARTNADNTTMVARERAKEQEYEENAITAFFHKLFR